MTIVTIAAMRTTRARVSMVTMAITGADVDVAVVVCAVFVIVVFVVGRLFLLFFLLLLC